MLKKSILLFAALTWTVIITILSLVTIGGIGSSFPIPFKDKMVHFVFYFVFVVTWSSYRKLFQYTKKEGVIILLIAIGFGVLMEVLQGVITRTRTPDVLDALANSTGAFIGFLIINRNFKNKRKI